MFLKSVKNYFRCITSGSDAFPVDSKKYTAHPWTTTNKPTKFQVNPSTHLQENSYKNTSGTLMYILQPIIYWILEKNFRTKVVHFLL